MKLGIIPGRWIVLFSILIAASPLQAQDNPCPDGWSIRGNIITRMCDCYADQLYTCSIELGYWETCFPQGYDNPGLTCPPGGDSGGGGDPPDDGSDGGTDNGGTGGDFDAEEELLLSIDDTLFSIELLIDERCDSGREERILRSMIRKSQQQLSRAKRLGLSEQSGDLYEEVKAEASRLRSALPGMCR